MLKIMACASMLVVALGTGLATAKHGGGGHGGGAGASCSDDKFERCLDHCLTEGGRGKSNILAKKCSKHCAKKSC